jgi:hypothetical protein
MAKKEKYKITFEGDRTSRKMRVIFTPKLQADVTTMKEISELINLTLAGTQRSLEILMGGFDVLRPATDVEREHHVYIFKDAEHDQALYKKRKEIYETFANVFNDTLQMLFPDVLYIDGALKYQQEFCFDKTPEEIEEYKQDIEKIAKAVKGLEPDDNEQIN